jgi:uncharacterized protein (DUF1684 family)
MGSEYLEVAGWRRAVGELYAAVRAEAEPEKAHAVWRAGRDDLLRTHPQTPLPPGDPLRESGVPYFPYNPALRFDLPLLPVAEQRRTSLGTGDDGTTTLLLIGHVDLPQPIGARLDVWWLAQYAGGIFLPLRDGTAGTATYGGGRYALDTAKGADLGGTQDTLTVDLNFLYHPSCRYNPRWVCPLAPAGNTTAAPVEAGERL